jgi:hypothetical protein
MKTKPWKISIILNWNSNKELILYEINIFFFKYFNFSSSFCVQLIILWCHRIKNHLTLLFINVLLKFLQNRICFFIEIVVRLVYFPNICISLKNYIKTLILFFGSFLNRVLIDNQFLAKSIDSITFILIEVKATSLAFVTSN